MKTFKEFLREEADTLSQPQIDTKTNNQMSNDSVVTSVPTNKTSVKNNLKSDTPPHSPEHKEYEEYIRWRDRQLKEWESDNPHPTQEPGMSDEEYQFLVDRWLEAYTEMLERLGQWYSWNTGLEGSEPGPDPKPRPRPRAPTWSQKPWWAGEIPYNNPNWWHMGPNESGPV